MTSQATLLLPVRATAGADHAVVLRRAQVHRRRRHAVWRSFLIARHEILQLTHPAFHIVIANRFHEELSIAVGENLVRLRKMVAVPPSNHLHALNRRHRKVSATQAASGTSTGAATAVGRSSVTPLLAVCKEKQHSRLVKSIKGIVRSYLGNCVYSLRFSRLLFRNQEFVSSVPEIEGSLLFNAAPA